MPVHEKEKTIEISGRRWRIKKFDPLTGSFIALKMMSKISHIAFGIVGGNLTDKIVIANSVAAELGSFSKQEFIEIQLECLHVVSEVKMVDEKEMLIPAKTPEGQWAASGLEEDALLVMALVSHVLIFNLTSFFNESALKETAKSFQGLSLFSALT